MKSVFVRSLGNAMRLPRNWTRASLFGCFLASGFAWSPASAEPCPNEFNTWIQFGTPKARAEVQALSNEQRYERATQIFYYHSGIGNLSLGNPKQWANDPAALRKAAQVLLESSAKAMPVIGAEYRYSACRIVKKAAELERGSGRQASPSPAPSPLAPATAKKLPPAQPAQSRRSEADAKYAAELLEYKRKLAAQRKAVADYNAAQRQMAADKAAAAARASAAQEEFARQRAAYEAELGRYASERAALSIGGQTPPWKQQGKDARIIASDGKSAMDCVKLIELTKTDSSTGGGGRVLSNQCSGPVEITWCYSPGDCDTETGSGWTIQAGTSWPVSAEKNIRWAACHGANTAAFVKGSHGLSYYCKAPE